MKPRQYVAALAVAFALALGGCAAPEEPGLKPAEEDSMTPSPDPSSSPTPRGPVAQAVADLASREGVTPEDVEVVSREEVTWRDGSLGCAEKGMVYTQALVEGGRIILRLGDTTYEYHYGARRAPFWCERPTQ
jgi:hypothetical protein